MIKIHTIMTFAYTLTAVEINKRKEGFRKNGQYFWVKNPKVMAETPRTSPQTGSLSERNEFLLIAA